MLFVTLSYCIKILPNTYTMKSTLLPKLSLLGLIFIVIIAGCKRDSSIGNQAWRVFEEEETGIDHENRVQEICIDANDNVYAGYLVSTSSFGFFYHPTIGGWYNYEEPSPNTPAYYLPMDNDADGSVWANSLNKIYQLENGEIINTYTVPPPDSSSSSIGGYIKLKVFNNEVWLLHIYKGLYKFDPSSESLTHYPDNTGIGNYTNLEIDNLGNKWVVRTYSPNRLLKLTSDGTWINYDNDDPLLIYCPSCTDYNHSLISSISISQSGQCYFMAGSSSGQKELFTIENGSIKKLLDYSQFYPHYEFQYCKFDRADNLWLYRYGLSNPDSYLAQYSDGGLTKIIDITEANVGGNVYAYQIDFDNKNNIWISTNKGIVVYYPNGIN